MSKADRAVALTIVALVAVVVIIQAPKIGHPGMTVMDQIRDGVYSQDAFDSALYGAEADRADGSFNDPDLAGMKNMAYLLEVCVSHPDLDAEEVLSVLEGSEMIPAGPYGDFTQEQLDLSDRIKKASDELRGVGKHPPVYSTGP